MGNNNNRGLDGVEQLLARPGVPVRSSGGAMDRHRRGPRLADENNGPSTDRWLVASGRGKQPAERARRAGATSTPAGGWRRRPGRLLRVAAAVRFCVHGPVIAGWSSADGTVLGGSPAMTAPTKKGPVLGVGSVANTSRDWCPEWHGLDTGERSGRPLKPGRLVPFKVLKDGSPWRCIRPMERAGLVAAWIGVRGSGPAAGASTAWDLFD